MLFQVSFLADTRFPVAFPAHSNPGENVSLRKNTSASVSREPLLQTGDRVLHDLTGVSFTFFTDSTETKPQVCPAWAVMVNSETVAVIKNGFSQ